MTSATSTAATTTEARHARHRRASPRGVSALMYACQQGDVDRVRKIVRAQPSSLLARDRTGKSPLHYCCTSDNIRAAQAADLLVMAAADLVEGRDEDGFTPLHLAVIAGNMPLVTFLIANNADINAVDNEKHTVVHWATVCGETAALRAVLAAGAPVSTPDVHGGYPLHYAAQMCGGERDSNLGQQVLQTLLTHSNIAVSVADGDGRQPLLWAASAGSAKAVLALVRAGALVEASDKDGLTALHCAASRGHTDCIDSLLTLCGASPDVIDSNGCTALHYAVTLGHADATALLLAHGADPNRQDRKGRSPAHCGCAKGQFETVKMIGAHGAKLWLKNARGDLPLHEAAGSGRRDLVKWLLEMRPSQVNARNNDGRCPLHLAALNDNADMCKILLDTGAQINSILRTSKNVFMTPLDCALQRGFRSTAKYLQLHGGVPATRLGDVKGKPDSTAGVNLQIRDDVTFWGDTSSDSERENGETKNKRVQRKRLAHKYDKKRASLSGSDLEGNKLLSGRIEGRNRKSKTCAKTDSGIDHPKRNGRKLPSGRFDYSNEIVINGKTEINIHQTKQITVGREGAEPVLEAEVKEIVKNGIVADKRPKSAKHSSKVREKSGTSTAKEDSARRKVKSERPQSKLKQRKEEAKIEELQQNGKSFQPGHDLTVKVPDQQSLMSNTSEDVEESASMVVEAAVHEPPKESKKIAVESKPQTKESTTKESARELTEELEQKAKEVTTEENARELAGELKQKVKEVTTEENAKKLSEESNRQLANEEDAKKLPEESKHQAKEVIVEQEAKRLTEGLKHQEEETTASESTEDSVLTIEDNVRQLKEDLKSMEVTKETSKLVESTEAGVEKIAEMTKIDNRASARQNDKVETIESITAGEETGLEKKLMENKANEEVKKEKMESATTLEKTESREDGKESQDVVEIKSSTENNAGEEVKNEDETVTNKLASSKEEDEKAEESGNGVEKKSRKIIKIDRTPEVSIDPNQSKADEEQFKEIQAKNKEQNLEGTENHVDVTVKGEMTKDHKNGSNNLEIKESKQDNEEEGAEKLLIKPKVVALPAEEGEKQVDEGDNAVAIVDDAECGSAAVQNDLESATKVEPVQEEQKQKRKHRKKWAKKGDAAYEIIDKSFADNEDVQGSKTSEESVTLSQNSDSSSSSTQKEHKSFRILDEKEEKIVEKTKRAPRKSAPNKQRSRSEETKSTKNREKLKRSKIPTPLIQNSLSKSDKYLDVPERKVKSNLESRVPSLPNIHQNKEHYRSESNMSAPLLPSVYSDNERGSGSDLEEERSSAVRKRRVKRRLKTRDSRSAGSDYESSNVIDSGFEPSPRSSRIPRWKNMSERGVNMTSVTQTIQTNIRRYHLERKIFQHLLELKRMQIRAGQHNEAILVKRAIDTYHESCASTVGAGRYVPEDYTFKSFEKFLYFSLRKLQRNGADHLKGLPEPPTNNPLLCTRSTHRCMHATHAYTGIPCAAYLPMMDHHTMPKIGFSSTQCKPGTGFLPTINPKKAVTLELCHGNDKQIISLPADKLDHNKRYYVTFTVKGSDAPTSQEDSVVGHTHAKSD